MVALSSAHSPVMFQVSVDYLEPSPGLYALPRKRPRPPLGVLGSSPAPAIGGSAGGVMRLGRPFSTTTGGASTRSVSARLALQLAASRDDITTLLMYLGNTTTTESLTTLYTRYIIMILIPQMAQRQQCGDCR